MTYTIEISKTGGWQVVDLKSRQPYGSPCDTLETAQSLVREAEAAAAMARMFCRAGSCSI